MSHKLTLRLEDDTWSGLEQFLAVHGVTANSFFESLTSVTVNRFRDEGAVPFSQWTKPLADRDAWLTAFERAKAMDQERRKRPRAEPPPAV